MKKKKKKKKNKNQNTLTPAEWIKEIKKRPIVIDRFEDPDNDWFSSSAIFVDSNITEHFNYEKYQELTKEDFEFSVIVNNIKGAPPEENIGCLYQSLKNYKWRATVYKTDPSDVNNSRFVAKRKYGFTTLTDAAKWLVSQSLEEGLLRETYEKLYSPLAQLADCAN